MSVFDLRGSPAQNALVERALSRCDYDFSALVPGLRAQTGRERIPVEWADLSRWGMASVQVLDGSGNEQPIHGPHAHDDGDEAHIVEARGRVLGLAWYDGRISLDLSLEAEPDLAQEVLLAEAAHMVDFFALTDQQRDDIFLAFHGNLTEEHGHGWFDQGAYGEWVGEAWMAGWTLAFSDVTPTIVMAHALSREDARRLLRPILGYDRVKRTKRGRRYHRPTSRLGPAAYLVPLAEARASGLVPCRTCRP